MPTALRLGLGRCLLWPDPSVTTSPDMRICQFGFVFDATKDPLAPYSRRLLNIPSAYRPVPVISGSRLASN